MILTSVRSPILFAALLALGAAALQAAAASAPDEGISTRAAQMEALQGQLEDILGTLEDVAADFEAVDDDDPAGLAAAWSRALTVNARELSWYRVDDPIILAARLALELDSLVAIVASVPDGMGAEYSLGYDFNTYGLRRTGLDGETLEDANPGPVAEADADESQQEFCPSGTMESGEIDTPHGPLRWRSCREVSDEDGYMVIHATQLRFGDEDNGSRAMIGIAVASNDAGIRDAMDAPAERIVEIMSTALTISPEEG